MLSQFFAAFPLGMVTALIQLQYAHHHQASGVSWLSIVSQVGCVVVIVGLTRVTLRQGRRLALVAGMGLMLAASMLGLVSALLDTDLLLYLVAFLLGAGLATNWYIPFAATDFSPKTSRASDFSYVLSMTAIGMALGSPVVNYTYYLEQQVELPLGVIGFTLCMLCCVASVIILWFGLHPIADTMQQSEHLSEDDVRFRFMEAPGASAAIVTLTAMILVIDLLWATTTVYVVSSENELYGTQSLMLVGAAQILSSLIGYGISPLFGVVADRLGRTRVVATGYGLAVIGCLILVVAASDTMWVLVAIVILGVGKVAVMVATGALLIDAVPRHHRVILQGWAGGISVAVAPLGTIMAFLGMPRLAAIGIIVLIIVFFFVFGAVRRTPRYD
ncbi:MFS transporter [uncultured Corynebacterium sp.]|jgi:transporter, major facilitator family protein|uniref:MFS transporter n=1 Tax=uncultured Corynebacterium sp. TaxID=159447 RepID=UPI0028D2FD91|nr:MFS transporter [uncultured Corynebacterium sp.]